MPPKPKQRAVSDMLAAKEAEEDEKVMKKVDRRLLPFLGLLYLLSFVDRVNIGNARATMMRDIDITETQYANAVAIFFIGYILCEVPSNVLLKKLSPHLWIGRIMVTWGIISVCMALVSSYAGLVVARFFLGIAEAGLVPGVVFYLTFWYTTMERATKISHFFGAAALSGAIAGLLAHFLLQLEGLFGLRGWQWLFILEGIPTIIIGILVFFYLPDGPGSAKWLDADSQARVLRRLADDTLAMRNARQATRVAVTRNNEAKRRSKSHETGDGTRSGDVELTEAEETGTADLVNVPESEGGLKAENFTVERGCNAMKDVNTLLFALVYFCNGCPFYAVAYFLPALIADFGMSPLYANLLTVPVYLVALVGVIVNAVHSDRFHERPLHVAIPFCVNTVALATLAGVMLTDVTPLKYIIVMLIAACSFAAVPPTLAWLTENLRGQVATGVGTAIVIACGNIGGLVGPEMMAASRTNTGHYAAACAGLMTFQIVGAIATFVLRKRLEVPSA